MTLRSTSLSRRKLLQQLAGSAACSTLAWAAPPPLLHLPPDLSADDDRFLNELEQANFLFFWEQASPTTGLVRDRANTRTPDQNVLASIAATGFGLTAICIGQQRGFISYTQARD